MTAVAGDAIVTLSRNITGYLWGGVTIMGPTARATSRVKLLTALVGLATAVVTLAGTVATQSGAFGDLRLPLLPGAPTAESESGSEFCSPRVSPELSLSTGRGPSGTELTVTGREFCPGEQVDIRFHAEQIGTARAGDGGGFEVSARVPGSFDAFAPRQFDITATGQDSLGSARVPFQLTTR